MRRYKITLAIACSLFWATSCQWNSENKEKTETPAVETKSSSEKQPVKQAENLTFSKYNYFKKSHIDDNTKLPGCTIDIHISYPSGGSTGNMSLNKIQSLFVASLPDGMQESNSPRTAVEHFAKNYIADYQAEIKPYLKKHKHRDEGWMNYEIIVKSENLYNADLFWGYSIETYTFTGGAHGMTTTSYNVVDLKSGKALSLKDLFAENDYNLINRMLCQQLADDLGTSVDKLGEKSYETENIIADDNFMISDKGITWLFNPYDIAPYSTGTTRITLPYRAIVGYLVADSPLKRIASK